MAVWGYGLLGPVEARVNDRVISLTGARQRLVLAVLLVDANRLVPADRFIDELWGADLPQDPPGALRTQISRLRRVLGPAGHGLVTDGRQPPHPGGPPRRPGPGRSRRIGCSLGAGRGRLGHGRNRRDHRPRAAATASSA
jgi:Transcriptional regulatory protein, C terminal